MEVEEKKHSIPQDIEASAGSRAVMNLWRSVQGNNRDLFASLSDDKKAESLHANSENHSPVAEKMVSLAQVVSACLDSLAHGSNDVANSLGPLAAVYALYNDAAVNEKSEVPVWMPVVVGAGIAAGVMMYGWKVMQTIGVKLSRVYVF